MSGWRFRGRISIGRKSIAEKIAPVKKDSSKCAIFSFAIGQKGVIAADIGHVFLESDGSISKEVMRDMLHLSPKGYVMWAHAMEPHLKALLKN